jgi:hypothetical protein
VKFFAIELAAHHIEDKKRNAETMSEEHAFVPWCGTFISE